ncbi:MAG: hypothetical protein JW801_09900 [Bacteroidales bacterium]|nr:hypothetical protein [Bacteroidales bacterium]
MKYGNEVVMLVFTLVGFIFILIYLRDFKKVKGFYYLFSAFLFFLGACIFTNIEGLFLENIFNFLEHLFYALCMITLLLWLYRVTLSKKSLT